MSILKKQRAVQSDAQLQLCVLNQLSIRIYVHGIYDCTGRIVDYNEHTISIEDGHYLRENCQIYLATFSVH